MLAVDAKRVAAGHEELEPRRLGEQPRDEGRGVHELLEVVQHEELGARPEVIDERRSRIARVLQTKRSRDLGGNEGRIFQRAQPNEEDAVREPPGQLLGRLQGRAASCPIRPAR